MSISFVWKKGPQQKVCGLIDSLRSLCIVHVSRGGCFAAELLLKCFSAA
jgi:hypothetical protein